MQSLYIEIIGYLAAITGTFLMLPQVIKSVKTRSAQDISLWMLIAYVTQAALWGVYGFFISAVPLVLTNMIAFCIGIIQLVLKQKYERKAHSRT